MKLNKEVSEYIKKSIPEHQELLNELRNLLADTVEDLQESYKWSRPVYGKTSNSIYLQRTKKHVTLGFFDATSINDELGLLEGSGKDMRHIKIKTKADMKLEVFRSMILDVKMK